MSRLCVQHQGWAHQQQYSNKSRTLSVEILSDYSFCHYNYKYDWLRPSHAEIIAAYTKLCGKRGRKTKILSLMDPLEMSRRSSRRKRKKKRV